MVLSTIGKGRRKWAVLLLLAGNLLGVWVLSWNASEPLQQWMSTVKGSPHPIDEDSQALGHWLARNSEPTMLDDRSSYAAIAARGTADRLVLPLSGQFKQALSDTRLLPSQVVVVDPSTPAGQRDTLSRRFPQAWSDGWPDYQLVFAQGPYRVWRRGVH